MQKLSEKRPPDGFFQKVVLYYILSFICTTFFIFALQRPWDTPYSSFQSSYFLALLHFEQEQFPEQPEHPFPDISFFIVLIKALPAKNKMTQRIAITIAFPIIGGM